MSKIKFICNGCNNDFYQYSSNRRYVRKFCSQKCRSTKKEFTCAKCNTKFFGRLYSYIPHYRFCSGKCKHDFTLPINGKKKCKMCNIFLEISNFEKDKRTRSGMGANCRDCSRKRINLWNKHHRDIANRRLRKFRIENPEKNKAHSLLNQAVFKGKLKKRPCIICGKTENIHGHHYDYSLPYDVIWVCAMHHRYIHAGYLKAEGGIINGDIPQ